MDVATEIIPNMYIEKVLDRQKSIRYYNEMCFGRWMLNVLKCAEMSWEIVRLMGICCDDVKPYVCRKVEISWEAKLL